MGRRPWYGPGQHSPLHNVGLSQAFLAHESARPIMRHRLACNMNPQSKIEVEGDSSLVISAIKGNMEDHSLAGGIVEFVKKSLQKFRSVRLLHVKRSGNVMAHVLAKHAKEIDTFHVWIEDDPSFFSDVFLKDSSMAISNSVPLSSQ
ncbi:hypothetical protein REPUB_Repub16aG0049600 [Reevesia pubescens]